MNAPPVYVLLLLITVTCTNAYKPPVQAFKPPAPPAYPAPTSYQTAWSNWEIGAMISFGMETSAYNVSDTGFCTMNTGSWLPPANLFNPQIIDTDQWAEAMLLFGAKYAVFTAKHCSGFALYPTKVKGYDYNIANITWMNGTDDIVLRFINSCKKYGIKPGLYYGVGTNYYLNIHYGVPQNTSVTPLVPGQRGITLAEYEEIVLTQLTELWTNYGELAEIWFDGGTYAFAGSIANLLEKFQPNAITFQGPPTYSNNCRWPGNEDALPPYPSWSTAPSPESWGGGDTPENGGLVWAPGESDTTIRQWDRWFWEDDYYDVGIKSIGTLMQEYEASTGANTNYLLNLSPDPWGRVPEADMLTYKALGAAITKCYGKNINATSSYGKQMTSLVLPLGKEAKFNKIVINEDQTQGQLIREYKVYYSMIDEASAYRMLTNGTSIGHKRIEYLPTDVVANYLRLDYTGVKGGNPSGYPIIANFAAHFCDRLY